MANQAAKALNKLARCHHGPVHGVGGERDTLLDSVLECFEDETTLPYFTAKVLITH